MRKLVCAILMLGMILAGCGKGDGEIGSALALRQKILSGDGCTFTAKITADYGDKLYTFTMECETDRQGNLAFTVREPEPIAGVTGKITETGGHLTFDGTALAFETIADGQVSPVTAPWLFMKTLRSGYISSSAAEGELTYLQIDDSYAEEALHLDIWLGSIDLPVRAEILWQGRRFLSLSVEDFTIL